jgi:opacity protein-like surface antigen
MKPIQVSIVLALVAMAAGRAEGQTGRGTYSGFFTGQVGITAGGDLPASVVTPSVSVSVQEVSGWGAELDLGYANGAPSTSGELDLATYMVNAIWQSPSGMVRPYGLGGVGAIQVRGCFTFCTQIATVTDLGVTVGGGALYVLNDVVGFRGDLRYFWAPGDKTGTTRPGNYAFWRVSAGVTFMWSLVP